MAQWVRGNATKSDNPSKTLGNHRWEERTESLKLSNDLYMYTTARAHPHTNKYNLKICNTYHKELVLLIYKEPKEFKK